MSSVASGASSAAASGRTRKDAAWEHALPITDEFRTKNRVGCKYCLNFFNGGITRIKKHLAGIRKDCTPCTQVPDHVKEQMNALIAENEKKKDKSLNKMLELRQEINGDDAGIRLFAQVVLGQEINGARVVTLNRPRQLNGINDRVVYLLAQLLEKWEKNDDAKLVIFKGAGRAFSAGGDLKMFYEGRSSDDSCLDMRDIMPNDLGLDGDAVQPDYDDHRTRCLLHRSSGRR